jgi:hypothetical protein
VKARWRFRHSGILPTGIFLIPRWHFAEMGASTQTLTSGVSPWWHQLGVEFYKLVPQRFRIDR